MLLAVSSTSEAHIRITGLTLQLNNVPYYVPPQSIGVIPQPANSSKARDFDLVPITVVTSNHGKFGQDELENTTTEFSGIDDVFQDGFLQGIYIQSTTREGSRFCDAVLRNCVDVHASTLDDSSPSIPDGPYFMSSSGSIFQAYRLYSDTQGSFSETTVRDGNGGFTVLPANIPGQSLAVAVPSRLYFQRTTEKPLAGVRLGVKDIYDLKGVKTSNGNRAWYNHYAAADATAPAVQNLIDAGAIVVGKMKTSQFANGETATADWVDYHSPFNPRGDGYQDGSSSSTGPASGEASYPWLDITLGSDTGGSIRSPSQAQGLYGNRPSHGLVSMKRVMPLAPEYDTAGIFARDPRLWAATAQALYLDNITLTSRYPSSVLAVGFPTNSSTRYDALLSNFLQNLTRFLSASVTPYNVEESWKADMPHEPPLPTLLNNTYELLTAKQQAKLVRDVFVPDYARVHDGRLPHVDPSPLQRWALGDSDPSTTEHVVAAKTKFMDWFNAKQLPRDAATCSRHILVYVPRRPAPKYRDTYLGGPSRPFPFSVTRLSVYSGAPDVVLPIGEVAYESAVTGRAEVLPVSVDVMAARGCDGVLFSLVRDLHAAGFLAAVKTGRSIVDGGQILY
ncbi:glutamyl-tRNA(Gln) amidotransferase [Metarhizium robertsii ARSEF 23]|nr:glutamyl-tRNA(Gln) amidotransferase [Metarhizium robertsii ARSEF 23]EFY97850.1 glutamyl-tRNA(Gln) amidotransferase [Metarhizium robertsii ARSEF 23]